MKWLASAARTGVEAFTWWVMLPKLVFVLVIFTGVVYLIGRAMQIYGRR